MKLRRARKTIGGILLFAAAVAIGVVVTWGYAVPGVASAAADLDEVDLTLGTAALVRSATGQAVLFAVDVANMTSSQAALDVAVVGATAEIDSLERLNTLLADQPNPPDAVAVFGLVLSARAVLDAIAAEDIDTARTLLDTDLDAAANAAGAALTDARAGIVAKIDDAGAMPAWLEGAARIVVTLAIPALLAVVFWAASKRRIRRSWAKAALEIEQLESNLEQSEDALESLAVRFRTPLTSIYGLSDLLVQKHQRQDLERELITLVHSESSELTRIADDALAATQLAAGKMTASATIVAFSEVVEEAVKPIRSTGTEVKVNCPETWVLTDGTKVQHILRNLVTNAAMHGAEPIFVEVAESDGAVECDIIDHGTEVAAGVRRDQVDFDPATGLGLKVAYELADLIGAELDHYRDGDRTCFTLRLIEEDPTATAATHEDRKVLRRLPRPLAVSRRPSDESRDSDEIAPEFNGEDAQ